MGSLRVFVGRLLAPIYFLFGVMTTISKVPPSLANVLSAFAFVRPVRRLDCLDPGGVIKWRASERVSLVRQRSWNFATRDSRAPGPTGLPDSRPLRRRRPSPSRSFDEFLQGYSNGRTNYRGTALHCRNGVDGPLGGPMQLGFF